MRNRSSLRALLIVPLAAVVLFYLFINYPEASNPDCTKNLPKGFADIKSEVPDIVVDIRYATRNNFVGEILEGYEKNCAWCVKEMIPVLEKISADLHRRGYRLKVYDAYRPLSAEWHMIRWALRKKKRHLLGIYVPARVNPGARFSHPSGNMIDVTLVGPGGDEINMGTDFDEFTSRAHTLNGKGAIKSNRLFLKRTMERYGFKNYSREWWHYSFRKKGHAALNVPIR